MGTKTEESNWLPAQTKLRLKCSHWNWRISPPIHYRLSYIPTMNYRQYIQDHKPEWIMNGKP